MQCPYCKATDSRVVDSRVASGGRVTWRRRECDDCKRRFTTYERVEYSLPHVIKTDGRREPFDRNKLLQSLRVACNKRPFPTKTRGPGRDAGAGAGRGRRQGDPFARIGERVMERLKDLDEVAYVRFASVYKSFRDIDEFIREMSKLVRPETGLDQTGSRPQTQGTPWRTWTPIHEAGARARRSGDPSPNPHVGAVIADGERSSREGFHEAAGLDHAEVVALQAAGDEAEGKTLYVTLEPCNHEGRTPPCVDAILEAGIARVVIGCRDPNPHVRAAGSNGCGSGRRSRRRRRREGSSRADHALDQVHHRRLAYLALKLARLARRSHRNAHGASRGSRAEARARVHTLRRSTTR